MKTKLIVRALIERDGLVLVNDSKRGPKLLGGHVKSDESLQAALERELREEVGLRVGVRDVVYLAETRKKSLRILTLVFRCHVFGDVENMEAREKKIRPAWKPRAAVLAWAGVIPFDSAAS